MFYAHFVLAKKGPLARIWLAAHWDKKLTKAHIFETNIESSVEGILHPKIKMALRTSGHLLLGVVRIYSRKAKYLLADCNEAFIKIKMAFRPGIVDLPEGNREAAVATITLPEVFHDFDTVIPDISIDLDTPTTLNQSRAEDITLKEDYGTLSLMADDGFGDMAFDDPEMARDATNIDEGFDHASLLLVDDKAAEPNETPQNAENAPEQAVTSDNTNKNTDVSLDPVKDNGFNGPENGELLDENANGLFESAGLFDDAPLGNVPVENNAAAETTEHQPTVVPEEQQQKPAEVSDDDDDDYGPPSVGLPSAPTSPESIAGDEVNPVNEDVNNAVQATEDVLVPPPPVAPPQEFQQPEPQIEPPQNNFNQNFLNHSEETFALAPLEALLYQGTERSKAKRKRKLIIDEVKNISGEEMKAQLADTTDIVTTLDLAPPTKRLMQWKETGGVEKLFALPGHIILSRTLARLYQRHLTTRPTENELFGTDEDAVQLGEEPEKPRDEPSTMQLRKRRRVQGPDFSEQISDVFSIHPELSTSHVEQEIYNPPPPPVSMEEPISTTSGLLIPPPPQESEDTILLLPEHVPLPEEFSAHNETNEVSSVLPPGESEVTQVVPESVPEVQETVQVDEPLPPEPVAEVNEETEKDENQEAGKDVNDNNVQQEKPFVIDDDEDYAAPASIGPMLPEEQMADETYEQFEERILNKRTTHMLHVIKRCLERGTKVPFSAIAREKKRKVVAQKFYTFLVLKKQQAVELEQSEPYGELYISRGPNFDSIYQ